MTTETKKYEDLLETVPCNLCGAQEYKVVYPAQYDQAHPENIVETFRSSGDEILVDQLVRCEKCGLEYLNPRLRQEIIIEGYSQGSDETFVSQASSREKTFTRCLNLIEKNYPQKGKILDVGTAGGSFLKVCKDRGWEVSGCEPNQWLTDWAKKNYDIDIYAGILFDMSISDNEFDVVTLWDVLEHTPDPKKVLKECYRILKPNGLLVVNYPDIGSFVSRLMGRKWVFLLSVHLYYFTPKTIRKYFKELDFEVVKFKKHWQSLELDYIFYRMKPYISFLSDFGRKLTKVLGLQKANIPYWVGQTLVFVKKKERSNGS